MDFANAGYKLTRIIAEAKGFTPERVQRAINNYCDMIKAHERSDVDYALCQLTAHAAVEQEIGG